MSSNEAFLVAIILIVILTLFVFIYIQYVNYNSKATNWNLLNLMGATTIALTLNSIFPQFLLIGRTNAQCNFLHHWAGSFYFITNWLVRLFFQCRSNQIAPNTLRDHRMGFAMIGLIIFISIASLVMFNATIKTILVPPLNVCVADPDPIVALMFVLVLPMLIDTAINIRFFNYIFRSTNLISTSISKSHMKAPRRLLRVTCFLSLSCMIISFICMMLVLGIIPIQDPTWVTVVLAAEQAYTACAIAWPAIYIFVRKRVKAYTKTSAHTGSAAIILNTNLSSSKAKAKELNS